MKVELAVEIKARPDFWLVTAERHDDGPYFRVSRRRIRRERAGDEWEPIRATVDAPKEGGSFENGTTWGNLLSRCFRTAEAPTTEYRIALEMKLEAAEKIARRLAGDE